VLAHKDNNRNDGGASRSASAHGQTQHDQSALACLACVPIDSADRDENVTSRGRGDILSRGFRCKRACKS
jgi:hypothetical protein